MIGTVEESKDYIYDLTLSSGSSVKYFSTNQMGFLIVLSLQFWPKNPYFRLDNFPFFSSDFPVRNFSPANFPFSRFS